MKQLDYRQGLNVLSLDELEAFQDGIRVALLQNRRHRTHFHKEAHRPSRSAKSPRF